MTKIIGEHFAVQLTNLGLNLQFTTKGLQKFTRRLKNSEMHQAGLDMCNDPECPFRFILDFSCEDGPVLSGMGLEIPFNRQYVYVGTGSPFEDMFDYGTARFHEALDIEEVLDDEFERLLKDEVLEKEMDKMRDENF